MSRLIIIVTVVFILISCNSKNKVPLGILPPDKMQAVLWDVIRADAYTRNFIKIDTTKNALVENARLQKNIFAMYQVSKETFYNSYEYYKTNPKLFKTLLDSMTTKASRDKTKVYQKNFSPGNIK